jgi:hypothetical protein
MQRYKGEIEATDDNNNLAERYKVNILSGYETMRPQKSAPPGPDGSDEDNTRKPK